LFELKEVLKEKILPLIKEENLELVELEFVENYPRSILRIFVDKIGGVDIEECAHLSRKLSDYLDTEDLIEQSYTLEISSPGLERPLLSLDDFRRKTGENVKVYLKATSGEKTELTGEIVSVREGAVMLKIENEVVTIPREKIEKGKIII
jgi:ribosome maturation factor RimP